MVFCAFGYSINVYAEVFMMEIMAYAALAVSICQLICQIHMTGIGRK